MLKLLPFIIILFSFHFSEGYSQDKIPASPAYIDTLIKQSWNVNELFLDSSRALAEKAVRLATGINYPHGLGEAYYALGYCMDRSGRFVQGIEYYTQAYKIKLQSGESSAGSAMGEIGYCYRKLGRLEDAMRSFRMAVDIAKKYHDSATLCNNLHRIGICHYQKGELRSAMEMYQEAQRIAELIGDRGILLRCYMSFSDIYIFLGDYTRAIEFANRSLSEALNYDDQREVAGAYLQLGSIFMLQKEYVKAKESFNRTILIAEMISDLPRQERALFALGDICMTEKQFDDALHHYSRAHLLAATEKSRAEEVTSLYKIGTVWMAKGNFRKAADFGEMALGIAEDTQDLFNQVIASELLWKAYRSLGDYRNALRFLEKFKSLTDSLSKQDLAKALTEKELKYKAKSDSIRFAKERDLLMVRQEKKDFRQSVLRYSILAGLLLAVSFLTIAFRQRNRLSREKKRSEDLLLNILPYEIAEEIKKEGHSRPRTYSMVTILFTDFKDFTVVSENMSAELLVAEIDHCFSAFDRIIQKSGVEKIKTVGDAYICAGGMPVLTTTHAADVVNAAIGIRDFMMERKKEQEARGGVTFEIRLGVHTGPVVAGIVGVKKYAYDIWGDTVNLAARMEQNSEAGKINISGSTYKLIRDKFNCTYRGKIEAKNKGEIEMYFVDRFV